MTNNLDEARLEGATGRRRRRARRRPRRQSQLDMLWRSALHAARAQRAREPHVDRLARRHPHAAHARQPDASCRTCGDARRILDVGTGGGFPGIPLAVACPQREFMLIDGTQKKIRFVDESDRGARHPQRAGASRRAPRATRRARTSTWWSCARSAVSPTFYITPATWSRPNGRLLAMKGRHARRESCAPCRAAGARKSRMLRVPGLDAERHLVALTRQQSRSAPE